MDIWHGARSRSVARAAVLGSQPCQGRTVRQGPAVANGPAAIYHAASRYYNHMPIHSCGSGIPREAATFRGVGRDTWYGREWEGDGNVWYSQ